MKKMKNILPFVIVMLLVSTIETLQAQEKRAQTAFKFISNPLGAKAAGLSDGVYSYEMGVESVFSNPASMARTPNTTSLMVGQVAYIADINYHYAAATYAPNKGLYGVFGIHVLAVDYGDFQETIRSDNQRGYIDLGIFSPRAFSIGLSYARAISNQFALGGTVKYLGLDLGTGTNDINSDNQLVRTNYSDQVFAFDFGIHYKTGFESLQIGFAFKNLSQEVNFNTENTEIPLTFRMGMSMDVLDLTNVDKELHSLMVSLDANRPRDFDEQLIIGFDYTFMKRFSLRTGYLFPSDEQGISFGAGINQKMGAIGLNVDYSYTTFGIFNNVNRFTVQFLF